MRSKMRRVVREAIAVATSIAAIVTIGCATKDDPISKAEKTEKDRPGIVETKAIAEEGFIYGKANRDELSLFINDKKVGEARIEKTCPSRFGAESFDVGMDNGSEA